MNNNENLAAKRKTVGQVLSELLESQDLNEHSLGMALHIPSNRIRQIIRGERQITLEIALRLARFFGTTPQYWLHLQIEEDLSNKSEKWAKALSLIQPHKTAAERRKEFEIAQSAEDDRVREEERKIREERAQRASQILDGAAEVYSVLTSQPIHFDVLCQKTGLDTGQVSAVVTLLALEPDLIVRYPGEWYCLAPIKNLSISERSPDIEPTQTADPEWMQAPGPEWMQATQDMEPVQATEGAEWMQATQETNPVQAAEDMKPMEAAEDMKPMQPTQNMQPMEESPRGLSEGFLGVIFIQGKVI